MNAPTDQFLGDPFTVFIQKRDDPCPLFRLPRSYQVRSEPFQFLDEMITDRLKLAFDSGYADVEEVVQGITQGINGHEIRHTQFQLGGIGFQKVGVKPVG